jgi:hypothetical protein
MDMIVKSAFTYGSPNNPSSAKLALICLLPFMAMASGLAFPVALPDQPVNLKRSEGVAFKVTVVPGA